MIFCIKGPPIPRRALILSVAASCGLGDLAIGLYTNEGGGANTGCVTGCGGPGTVIGACGPRPLLRGGLNSIIDLCSLLMCPRRWGPPVISGNWAAAGIGANGITRTRFPFSSRLDIECPTICAPAGIGIPPFGGTTLGGGGGLPPLDDGPIIAGKLVSGIAVSASSGGSSTLGSLGEGVLLLPPIPAIALATFPMVPILFLTKPPTFAAIGATTFPTFASAPPTPVATPFISGIAFASKAPMNGNGICVK